jgi:transcriptional regulator with XRE-family HTH domain
MAKKSKLGEKIKKSGLSQKEFAELVFEKTGYFIAVTNLSNYCSGYKPIRRLETARLFAEVLKCPIEEIL